MKKILYIGKNNENMDIFCKAEYNEQKGTLSISGVIDPRRNGNAGGSCGQINDTIGDDIDNIKYATGWDKEKLQQFLYIWDEYHLNDMRPWCEHQKAQGYKELSREKVTFYKWEQTDNTMQAKRYLEEMIENDLKEKSIVQLRPEQKEVYFLPYTTETLTPEVPKYYKADGTETKTRGWIDYDEYPAIGLLGKPCSVCGYKYGHAWKKEEIPQSAINFINSLPNAEKDPAWI